MKTGEDAGEQRIHRTAEIGHRADDNDRDETCDQRILDGGGATIVGGWLSVTVTFCVHVAVLPELSVTVQVTVVTPTG